MRHILKIPIIIFFFLGEWSLGLSQTIENTDSIYSDILKEYREFSIWTPENYSLSTDSCVILYLLDGKYHSNYVSASLNYLSEFAKTIPNIIVVGINQENRFKELGFNPDIIMQEECHAKEFSEFIINELSPHIENKYRIYSYRILAGHSLGANFTLYNLMYYNDFYNAFLAVSPDFTRDTILLSELGGYDYKHIASKTVLYSTHEKYLFIEKEKAQKEISKLIELFDTHFKAKYEYDTSVNHMSITPTGFITGVNYIFKDFFLPKEIVDVSGLPGILAHYSQVEEKYGIKIKPDFDLLLNVSYSISFKDNKHKEALEIVDYCSKNYPENYMTYWIMGEIYLNMEEKEIAMEFLNKAVGLNPNNNELTERIKVIKTKSH